MGRIKKAAADKHGATLPPVLSEFVSKVTTAPIYELPDQLGSFPHHWPFPRGDLYHWIPVLDRFDEVLEEVIKLYNLHDGPQLLPFGRTYLLSQFPTSEDETRASSELDKLQYGEDGDRQLVESVLRFSRRLMDNCGNRSLYNSSERLNDLINTTSLSLLLEILRLASRLALRYNFSRVRSATPNTISPTLLHSHYNISLEHVQRLAEPFSRFSSNSSVNGVQDVSRKGKEKLAIEPQEQQLILEPNDFVELLEESVNEKTFAEYTTVSFRYYQLATPLGDVELHGSTSNDRPKTPTTPTPVRRTSGLSKQHKLQDGEPLASPEKSTSAPSASTESGQRTITIDSAALSSQSLEEILKQYLSQLPKSSHFDFLARLQIAKALISGPEARVNVVEMRLLAIMNLAYIYPERDFQHKLLAHDSDEPRRLQIVNQLAEIIRPVAPGQPKLRMSLKTTAISTLEALSKHKNRFGDVCAALQINVNHGIIFQILHSAIAELAVDDGSQFDELEEDWRDALLSLLEILPSIGTNARTAETLISAGFFDMLVKELELRSAKAERVHYKVLMFVITMNHMVRDALQTFANSKGFDVVSDLLAYEVRTAVEDVKSGNAIPEAHKSQIMDYQMSFFKQQTLRWLFKFINSMLSQQGSNVERLIRNLIDSPPLLTALREVIENARIFGATTWSGAINVLSSFIHNEPTSYAIIVEAGLSKTLLESISQTPINETSEESGSNDTIAEPSKVLKCGLDAVKVYDLATTDLSTESPPEISLRRPSDKPLAAGILAATEPIVQIPHALGALCLNPSGQDLFLKSNVLEVYLQIFESPAHVKILSTDVSTAKILGTTFDELMRHHPRLKHTIIRAIIISLARVSYLCNQLAITKDEGAKLIHDKQTGTAQEQQQTDVNGDVEMTAALTSNDTEGNKANKDDPTASDYLSVMVNFLQGFCENATACASLIQAGAVEFILDLATAPSLPYNFNSRSESLELARVLHSLIDSKPHLVLPSVIIRLENSIAKLGPFMNYDQSQSVFSNYLDVVTEDSSVEDGTVILKALVELHTLCSVLQECLASSTVSSSRNSNTLFIQVNLADHWSNIVEGLLQIQPACIWEEILLLKNLPASLRKSTFVDGLRTGIAEADRALGIEQVNDVSASTNQSSDPETDNQDEPQSKDKRERLRSQNVPALRYVLSQVPLTITPLLQGLAKSLVAKRKFDHYVRQNAYKVAGILVRGFMQQLDHKRVLQSDDLKDRYAYFAVILTGFNRLIIDTAHEPRNFGQCMTLLVVMFKRQEDGLPKMNEILKMFFDYVQKSTSDDADLLSCALGGIEIILGFYTQLVSSRCIVEALQSQALQSSDRERDKEGYYYFSGTQLLVDLRAKILSAIKPIWDSINAEKASVSSLKSMMEILRTVFESDSESGVRKMADGPAMMMHPDPRLYHINRERLAALQSRGASEDLAREACFRLLSNSNGADEYCDMHLRQMGVGRLTPPENEIRRDLISTSAASTTINDAHSASDTTISEPSDESSPANPARSSLTPVAVTNTGNVETPVPFNLPLPTSTSMELDTNSITPDDDDDDENGMAMSIDNQLILSEPTLEPPLPVANNDLITATPGPRPPMRLEKVRAPDVANIDELNELREAVRKELVDKVLDVMSAHEGLTFDLADLIISATKKAADADDMRRDVCTTLVESLVSFMGSDLTTNGKKIADHCNLLAVVLQDDEFYQAAGSELREYFSSLVGFVSIPTDEEHTAAPYPWIPQSLVLMEKMLAEDVMPISVSWTAPTADPDGNYNLPADHEAELKVEDPKIPLDDRRQLLDAILNILPQVGKDAYLGLSIVRVLVILTRSRELADELGKKHNLQRLFLMVKQLAGIFDMDFQKTFIIVLRHVIEDESIIKEVMRAEIATFWSSGRSRGHDLSSYLKVMAHLTIRGPELFVSVTEDLVKITNEHGSRNGQYVLALKGSEIQENNESTKIPDATKSEDDSNEPKPSTEETVGPPPSEDQIRAPELKVPIQQKPDGVIHWLLSQLLLYKDVEDKDMAQPLVAATKDLLDEPANTTVSEASDVSGQTDDSTSAKTNSEKKTDKAEWVGEQHPHFHYRCFLLETLTELLESYQCAKLEFINFKQETRPTTPSKPRPVILNYLLTKLIPVGTLVKVDSINMKKKDAQSQWAISLIVALCLKSNHLDANKNEETTGDAENDLTYIRKFVLESSLKAFKDAAAADEPLDSKYGRLLNLADLFCRLLLGRAVPKNLYNTTLTATVQKGIAKIMFEKNYIAMLTSAIADLDLNFPNSRRAVKYILRPLKLLTETAIELSQNAEIFITPGAAEDDNISLATSVPDIDMDREETPDLFRNSTLGILDPGRDEESSSESEDGEEETYESGYDDGMEFDDEIERDDDEVVSDDDEEIDDAGPIEGLSGDHPMDVEVIIDGDDDDDSDEDDTEDDSDEDDMDDDELEVFDEISGDDEDPSGDGTGEDDWEDDDEDEDDDGEDHGERLHPLQEALSGDRDAIAAIIGGQGGNDLNAMHEVLNHMAGTGREESAEPPELFNMDSARLGEQMRQMHQMDQMEPFDFSEMQPFNPAVMHEDEEDEDEDDEDGEDDDVEPDYEDEGEVPPWGWDEGDELGAIPPPRHHHHHWGGGRRNPWTAYPHDEDRGMVVPGPSYRQHGRAGTDAGPHVALHPLLQRTQSSLQRQATHQREVPPQYTDFLSLLARERRSGSAMNLINSMIGAMGAGGVIDVAGPGGTLHVQIGGRDGAAFLPFPNSDMLRLLGHPSRQQPSSNRQSRHYDHSLIPRFVPGRTTQRWRFEAMMLCGVDDYVKRAQAVLKAIEKALVPASLEETKIQLMEERKAIEEERAKREAEKKAEEEKLAKEKAEKEAKEQHEREEKEAAEREAASRIVETGEPEESQGDGAMEGVETTEAPDVDANTQHEDLTEPEQPRVIATFRGREVDISVLGIDLEYLDALPDELREEVLMQQLAEQRSQAVATGQDGDEISPEFLAALPEDIRQELLQQEARDRRRREHAEARIQAQANGQVPRAEDMDPASFLASLDPTLRASVLVEQGEDILDQLPPAIAAEARALGADRARYFTRELVGRGAHRLGTDRRYIQDNGDDPIVKKPKRQIVQMLDKPGVATLLRLLFVSQQGNGKDILNDILRNISLNRQNRAEVIGLLLTVLQEGSMDAAAVEKSFAQLSLRAKQPSSSQRTPLKRVNTGSLNSALILDMSPATIIQQCLSTLVFLTRENMHVPSFFLTESEGFAKSKAVRKGKGKDAKASKFALNSLLSLLDRPIILDSAGCMEQLSTLLQHITHPLTILAKKDKKAATSDETQEKLETAAEGTASTTVEAAQPSEEDQIAQAGEVTTPDPSANRDTESAQTAPSEAPPEALKNEESSKKQRNLVPPVVPQENLRLVVSILAARECSAKTFRDTVSTISNLSAIPEAKETFGKELISQAQHLGRLISQELDELIPQVENAKDSTDAQGVPAMTKFAAPAADQAKLLRVLTALDYLFDPKRNTSTEESGAGSSYAREDALAGLYESASFGPLWQKLSDCLTAMKDKNYVLNVATILLPLIESLMVICKNTTIKDAPIKPTKEFSIASPEPESLVENLFFQFTEEHRKILNELVRHNPRLMSGTISLLVKNPKVLEFDNKRNYFTRRLHSRGDQRRSQPPLNLPIRRDRTFLDSFQALYYKSPDEIKYGKLNIRFHGEEGVDAGGVTREWFQVMARQMFDPDWALFSPVAADRTTFHPNKLSHINEPHLMWFKFIGRIIGKALYEGRALDCHFSRAVYKKILGKSVSVKDMETLDLEYYKSLIWMLENDITELIDQTFSLETEAFGVTEVVDLIPNGRTIAVTEENKQEYVQLIVEYRLIGSVKEQLEHFLKGFHDIVPAELINIFNEQELELLISGLPEIDVEDWKNNTDYHQYTISSPQIQWFWRAVRSFDKEERAKLLQFVTGTSKVPLNGFKELEGMNGFTRFNIHRDYGNKDRLPSSHTCFNQLDLPEYESYETLRQRLYTAITTGSDYFGFA